MGAALSGAVLRVGGLRGLGVSQAVLVSTGDVEGVTGSVLSIVKGDLVGGQVGAVNMVTGTMRGLQFGGGNLSAGGFTGVMAGYVNVAMGPSLGAQLGGVNIGMGDHVGAEVSAANLRLGAFRGLQFGGGNLAGDGFTGLQGGALNIATGPSWGAQLGLVNVGGDVTGSQVGLINFAAHVKGTQVGLLNIAQTSDAPVGLLNIITQGNVKLAAWASETSVANLAFKIGGQHVYSMLSLGLNPRGSVGRPYVGAGFGLGVRVPVERWYGELEGTFDTLFQVPKDGVWEFGVFAAGLRLNVGFQVLERVAVFAGPQVQIMESRLADQPVGALSSWGFGLGDRFRLVPGAVLGVQFL